MEKGKVDNQKDNDGIKAIVVHAKCVINGRLRGNHVINRLDCEAKKVTRRFGGSRITTHKLFALPMRQKREDKRKRK